MRIVYLAALAVVVTAFCVIRALAQETARPTQVTDEILRDAAKQISENSRPYEAEIDNLFVEVKKDLAEELKRLPDTAKLEKAIATQDVIKRYRQLINDAADSAAFAPSIYLPKVPPCVRAILDRTVIVARRTCFAFD